MMMSMNKTKINPLKAIKDTVSLEMTIKSHNRLRILPQMVTMSFMCLSFFHKKGATKRFAVLVALHHYLYFGDIM